jgi:hypothetical protein
MSLRKLMTGAIAASLALAVAPAAGWAASATATGTISGSTLTLTTSAAPTFSANLDSGDATPTYAAALAVQDTRGAGSGWNATITSTQFTTGGGTPSTLSTGASSLTGVSVTAGTGTNTNPSNAITYPVAVPAAATAPTAVKFFNAAAGSGMGKFTVTPTIGVFVPQNSIAGSYTSTLTVAIVSGP